jgi:glycosyltransferase involved in cell wall biosynthesis
LRLAVVSPFIDRRHGTERSVAELLERLARDYRCEIHLFSQHVEDLVVTRWTSHHQGAEGVIFWHPVPSLTGLPLLFTYIAWFFLNRFSRWTSTAFHRLRFDLVLSPGINCSDADVIVVHVLFHRLQQLSREQSPVLGTPAAGRFRLAHRRLYYSLLASFERRIYSKPRVALGAVSPRTAAQLAEYFHRDDVQVAPYGVDTSLFFPADRAARRAQARGQRHLSSNELLLLLIGNDWGNKGLGTILQALALLPNLPLRLLIVGRDAPEHFQTLARTLGVFDRCFWEQPSTEVREFYAAADVYVSPSREDSFGLPVAEAMACGLPAITSAGAGVGGLVEDGVDGFVLSDPLDADGLAKLLRLLADQPQLRERIGEAAANTARKWTWDNHAALVWQLLSAALARKSAR